jgi:hypothetical protein
MRCRGDFAASLATLPAGVNGRWGVSTELTRRAKSSRGVGWRWGRAAGRWEDGAEEGARVVALPLCQAGGRPGGRRAGGRREDEGARARGMAWGRWSRDTTEASRGHQYVNAISKHREARYSNNIATKGRRMAANYMQPGRQPHGLSHTMEVRVLSAGLHNLKVLAFRVVGVVG